MFQGNIGAWKKNVGDKIQPGDVLCSIETDKATVDFEMQEEGYIAQILFPAGTKDIPLGTPLAIVVDNKEDVAAFKDYKAGAPAAPAAPATPAAQAAPAAPAASAAPASKPAPQVSPASSPASTGDRVFVSPLAKNAANAAGINLASVQGTGPNGRIVKADIDDALASKPHKPTASATAAFDSAPGIGYTDITNSQIRKVIADRLTFSKQNIPHYYVTIQCQVDNLMKMRAKLNAHSKSKLSVNDFVIKAASLAALKVPATNSSWQ